MPNRLKQVGKRFRAKYKTVTGFEFYGQMLEIPDTARVSNFLSARRYLRTSPECELQPSSVIIVDGVKFIVGDHGTGFYKEPIYKHYKLFQVDVQTTWKKIVETQNLITGVKNKSRTEQEQTVYLSLQPRTDIEDSIKIAQQTYLAICNIEPQRNDIVDNKVVTKVDKVLGCYLLELKEI